MKIWIILLLIGVWSFAFVFANAEEISEELQLIKEITPGEMGGQLIVGSISDPKTFNIILAGETSSTDILDRMYAGLVEFDLLTQEYKPGLAKSWEHSPDYKEWTFYLRRGIRWSDGKLITADDVVFTFDVIYNPDIPNSLKDLLKVDGKNFTVTKIDDYTVKVTLPDTYGPFLYVIGIPILPKHKLEKSIADKTFNQIYNINVKPEELVVNGPFLLDKFVSGEKTVLKRNPFYWKQDIKNQRLPYLENIVFLNVPDINALMLKFQAGETDLYDVRGDRYQTIKDGEAKGNYTVYDIGPGLGTEHLWFNLNADKNPETGKPYVDPKKLKWFQQVDFRRAVSHAIDRQSIARVVYRGRAIPNYGPVSPADKRWHNPDIPKYEYNLEKAKALLDGLGFIDRNNDGIREDPEGNKISFTIISNQGNNYREKMGNIICDSLRQIGLDAQLKLLDFNTLVVKLNDSYDYEACLLGLTGSIEPVGGMNVFLSSGRMHQWYPNQKTPATPAEARIDELMNKYLKEPTYEKQREYFFEVQHILAEQQFMIYTIIPNIYVAVRNKFGNIRPTALTHNSVLWNADEIFIKRTP